MRHILWKSACVMLDELKLMTNAYFCYIAIGQNHMIIKIDNMTSRCKTRITLWKHSTE